MSLTLTVGSTSDNPITMLSESNLPNRMIVNTFIALQLTGGIGMSLIFLTTLFSPSITRRNMIWYSFCFSWIVSCTSYCLLFFAGQQTVFDQETPSYGLCLTQAALIYSGPPTTGATTFALFFDVYQKINAAVSGAPTSTSRFKNHSPYVLPYVLWAVLTVSFLIYGSVFPNTVQRDVANTYCVLNSTVPPVLTSALVVVTAMMVLITLGVLINRLKKSRAEQFAGFRNNHYLRALFIRLLVFTGLAVIAICIGIVYTFNRTPGPQYDLALASLPVAGFLVFGTQKDIIREWVKLFQKIKTILCCSTRVPKAKKRYDIALRKPNKNFSQAASQEILLPSSSIEEV